MNAGIEIAKKSRLQDKYTNEIVSGYDNEVLLTRISFKFHALQRSLLIWV